MREFLTFARYKLCKRLVCAHIICLCPVFLSQLSARQSFMHACPLMNQKTSLFLTCISLEGSAKLLDVELNLGEPYSFSKRVQAIKLLFALLHSPKYT